MNTLFCQVFHNFGVTPRQLTVFALQVSAAHDLQASVCFSVNLRGLTRQTMSLRMKTKTK